MQEIKHLHNRSPETKDKRKINEIIQKEFPEPNYLNFQMERIHQVPSTMNTTNPIHMAICMKFQKHRDKRSSYKFPERKQNKANKISK